MNAMRMTLLSIAAIMLAGIWLTGFDKVHWLLYVPPAFLAFAGLIGICPGSSSGPRRVSRTRRSPAKFPGRNKRAPLYGCGSDAMNLLFVCNANRLRSPTAEAVFADYPGVQAKSAGINTFAGTPLSAALIQWADIIFVMEEWQREEISLSYPAQLTGTAWSASTSPTSTATCSRSW